MKELFLLSLTSMSFGWYFRMGFLIGMSHYLQKLLKQTYSLMHLLTVFLVCVVNLMSLSDKMGIETVIWFVQTDKTWTPIGVFGFKMEPWGHIERFLIILFRDNELCKRIQRI